MTRYAIENMNCGGCAKGVTSTIKGADPSAKVEFQIASKQITVDGGSLGSEALLAALRAGGWRADVATT